MTRQQPPGSKTGLPHVQRAGCRQRAGRCLGLVSLLCLMFMTCLSASAQVYGVLDNFDDLQGWTTVAAPGAHVNIVSDTGHHGRSLRIDFDFRQGGGSVIVHKAVPMTLPANYAFRFFLRGDAPRNNFEFRLVDPSSQNVWWHRKREYSFPGQWKEIVIKPHHLEFAWGPAGGGAPEKVQTLEFVLSVVEGGKGSIWIDDLRFEQRDPPSQAMSTPQVVASSFQPDRPPSDVFASTQTAGWQSGTAAEDQWLLIDFRTAREFGGLVIDWDEHDYATRYQVQTSVDGEHWSTAYTVTGGHGGRDYVYLPDAESQYLRLILQRSSRHRGYGIRKLTVKPYAFSASPNEFFRSIAQEAPRGSYPKYLYGEQSYWTLIGVNGDEKEALLNEEGMLEVEKRGFSLEPFLYLDGKLITWNDAVATQELEQGYQPIPSVTWQHDRLELTVTALATGHPGASALYVRYRIENTGPDIRRGSLFLAVRPFQVNPPWQSLNMVGGVGRINEIRVDGSIVWVNRDKAVIPLSSPDAAGVASFDMGLLTDLLSKDQVPARMQATDPEGFASGVLQYALQLAPGAARDIDVAIPFHDSRPMLKLLTASGGDRTEIWPRQYDEARRYWESALKRVDIQLPPGNEHIINTLRSTLAYILINRDGPALRPGSRCYARSWIRDGALTSSALLESGFASEVRDFITWYAGYQLPDGRIPCCLDPWGADLFAEHDSQGEFIYLVAEYYRHTRDAHFLKETWPHVVKAIDYINSLRKQRLTAEFKAPDKLPFYGLMPESASHEGYAAHPVHSYWDDFWVLRGLKDAVSMAEALGDHESLAHFTALRDEFQRDLYASISRTQARRQIDYVPASVELADFDPTSTAIALDPGGEQENLPRSALMRTFEIYAENLSKRIQGQTNLSAYSPYEFRNAGALLRLGRRDSALQAIEFFLMDRRPLSWNQWAEVVWRDPETPRFIGDMPHTWVGSDYIRAVYSLFAFERESDNALVIGAGLPRKWIDSQVGVTVRGLATHYGRLSYQVHTDPSGEVVLTLDPGLTVPPGKIVFEPPADKPLRALKINGRDVSTFDSKRVVIGELPAEVRMR